MRVVPVVVSGDPACRGDWTLNRFQNITDPDLGRDLAQYIPALGASYTLNQTGFSKTTQYLF